MESQVQIGLTLAVHNFNVRVFKQLQVTLIIYLAFAMKVMICLNCCGSYTLGLLAPTIAAVTIHSCEYWS